MPTENEEKNKKKTTKIAEPVEKKTATKATSKKTTTKKTTKPVTKKETGTKSTAQKETSTKTKTKKTTTKRATTKKAEPSKKTEKKPVVEETVDMQEMQKILKQEVKSKKTVTEEQQKKMNGEVFKNIIIAIAIVLFLNCIILGFINIENSIFIVDLKVFALSLLAVAIGIFEFAYKKDSGKAAIYGIEILLLAFCMLVFIYIDIMLNSKFVIIAVLLTYAIAIYYTVKSIIVYKKMKKQYLIDSIKKEIVKK